VSGPGAEVVQGLLEAKGHVRTRNDLRAARRNLKDESHIERILNKLPRAVRDAILTDHKGSRIKEGYLG
jgi:hypothetical protein